LKIGDQGLEFRSRRFSNNMPAPSYRPDIPAPIESDVVHGGRYTVIFGLYTARCGLPASRSDQEEAGITSGTFRSVHAVKLHDHGTPLRPG
jgi:hypothetical protein